jgi:alpha-amylase
VNTNYGTAEDLLALSVALHDRDMYLMVDVVANHMVITQRASIYQG